MSVFMSGDMIFIEKIVQHITVLYHDVHVSDKYIYKNE